MSLPLIRTRYIPLFVASRHIAMCGTAIKLEFCYRTIFMQLFIKSFVEANLMVKFIFFILFYFYLYIYPPDSQESDGGAIHKKKQHKKVQI